MSLVKREKILQKEKLQARENIELIASAGTRRNRLQARENVLSVTDSKRGKIFCQSLMLKRGKTRYQSLIVSAGKRKR